MKYFSKRFSSLLESMKSSPVVEGRGDEEKGRKRLERKGRGFDNEGEFKIKPFISACEILQKQIKSTSDVVKIAVKQKSGGSKYADPIIRSLDSLMNQIFSLSMVAQRDLQQKGSKLDRASEADTISQYQEIFSRISTEYQEVIKNWDESEKKALAELPIDNANKNLEAYLQQAKTLFNEAKEIFNTNLAIKVDNSTKTNDDNKGDQVVSELTTTIKKRSKAYTGKDGEIVIEVKKLIYEKYKGVLDLTKTGFWKEVYRNGVNKVTGLFGPNTNTLITVIKGTLEKTKDDKTGDITPLFYTTLKNSKLATKENLNHFSEKIVSFDAFMKSKINEDGGSGDVIDLSNISGLIKNVGSGSSSGSKSKPKPSGVKVPKYSATPFKTKEEGNKFREWVNKKDPAWAKENNLDTTGPENNNYIRKAYAQFSEAYIKDNKAPETVKKEIKLTNAEMSKFLGIIKKVAGYTALQFTTDTSEPVIYYRGDSKSQSKGYGHFYNNFKVSYVTSSGKKFWGNYNKDKNTVDFGKGKVFGLASVVQMTISNKLAGENVNVAQGKKAYVSKSGDGYVNVRSSAEANTGYINNLIYKHTSTNPIGLVISSTVAKSSKIGDKTWYKVQFPSKKEGREYGYVRADTVDLK